MKYLIYHITTYTYDRPVTLSPHTLRLRPRCDITQKLRSFELQVDPMPQQILETLDLEGNNLLKLYFTDEPTNRLEVCVTSAVETFRENPFAYLLESWATHLPIDYPAALLTQLQPYLSGNSSNFPSIDPVAVELAHDLWHSTGGNPIRFLGALNQRIYDNCTHVVREQGDPLPPGITWKEKQGSCRDVTVLFIEVCRAIGLAARFVSGYQEGDLEREDRDLHAWAEVYLPGAGWRGYDPTQGLAVGDRHIALVASPTSRHTAPISGSLKTGVGATAEMKFLVSIKPDE